MKISQDIRAEAQAGMEEKAREFRESGASITSRNSEILIGDTL